MCRAVLDVTSSSGGDCLNLNAGIEICRRAVPDFQRSSRRGGIGDDPSCKCAGLGQAVAIEYAVVDFESQWVRSVVLYVEDVHKACGTAGGSYPKILDFERAAMRRYEEEGNSRTSAHCYGTDPSLRRIPSVRVARTDRQPVPPEIDRYNRMY